MVILVILIIIFILSYALSCINYINENFSNEHHKHHKNINSSVANNNICTGNLTDLEYLEHMIPHHQVAVDVSYMLQKKTKWPLMQEILRKIIWVQKYEIILMKEAYKKLPKNDMSSDKKMSKNYISTVSDFIKPNSLGLTNTYCDPHFFNPEEHMKHLETMNLDDKMYIKHMIPHHQVAVDMSKKLLENTSNDFMIYLGYRIIRSQQAEIVYLNDILENLESKNKYYYESNLI